MRTVITADRLWNGGQMLDRPAVVIEGGQIVSIGAAASDGTPCGVQTFRYPGATLAPAYFDVHIHGSAGHDVMEATPDALGTIGRFLGRHGVGSYLATTVTAPIDATLRALSGIAKWIQGMPGEDGLRDQARMIGIHFEGPFLSHLRRGVHPPEFLLEPDIGIFDRMFEAAEGHVRLMTLAPELPGAIELARHAIAKGVRVSVGHSNATAPETRAAIAAGAVSATHTYNAMRPLDHRDPGILGTVLSTDSLYAELICDGIHTAPEVVRIWWRSKGPERAILITDAMSAAGMPDGRYRLGDMYVQVKDGRATAGDALAGSLLTLNRGLANCIAFTGAPLEQALRLVTSNPAAMTGLGDRTDTLAAGRPANLVAVDAAGRLIASIRNGQPLAS
ncbi:MAG: N-acetylglucosamine-6-phosphate deacetylase [Terracidiphilus sp.]